jgi:Phage terminase, small subunit
MDGTLSQEAQEALAGLKIRQRAFALHYAQSNNAMQSAIAAGYSPKSAGKTGHRLANSAKIRAVVALIARDHWEAHMMSSEETQGRIGELTRMLGQTRRVLIREPKVGEDGRPVLGEDGEVVMEPRAITVPYATANQLAALDKLARIHSLYVERVQHELSISEEMREWLDDLQRRGSRAPIKKQDAR